MEPLVLGEALRAVVARVLPEAARQGFALHHKQQFVVKRAGADMEFAVHQDSGYMWGEPHTPWVTCWIALDDVQVHKHPAQSPTT